MNRPFLLVDVDGPLNPYRSTHLPAGYTTHRLNGFQVRLNPAHGPALQNLGFDLVWATTWEHDANTMIGPIVGLPELPAITWQWQTARPPGNVNFKTPTVVGWAKGRPFAWIDDELTADDRAYVAARHDGPALLHTVDPTTGLTDDDFAALTAWARTLQDVS